MSATLALQRSRPDGTLVLCGLATVGGTIHVVAVQHVGISWTLGAFFALVGIAQLGSAIVIVRRARRPTRCLAWFNRPTGQRLTYAVLTAALLTAAMGGHQH